MRVTTVDSTLVDSLDRPALCSVWGVLNSVRDKRFCHNRGTLRGSNKNNYLASVKSWLRPISLRKTKRHRTLRLFY